MVFPIIGHLDSGSGTSSIGPSALCGLRAK